MQCKITDLRNKEIINISNGMKMGGICDIEIDTETGELVSIIVYGRQKLLGFGQGRGYCDSLEKHKGHRRRYDNS